MKTGSQSILRRSAVVLTYMLSDVRNYLGSLWVKSQGCIQPSASELRENSATPTELPVAPQAVQPIAGEDIAQETSQGEMAAGSGDVQPRSSVTGQGRPTDKSEAKCAEEMTKAMDSLMACSGRIEQMVASTETLAAAVENIRKQWGEGLFNVETIDEQAKAITLLSKRVQELDGDATTEHILKPILNDVILLYDRVMSLRKESVSDQSLLPQILASALDCMTQDILETLARYGVLPMEDTPDIFDRKCQRAVKSMAVPIEKNNSVLEKCRKGFVREGKILRYEEVVVGKSQQ